MAEAKKAGQPKTKDWERVRTVAWGNWVRFRTQQKMDAYEGNTHPPRSDPFVASGVRDRIEEMLDKPKRTRTVVLSDLNEAFQANKENAEAGKPKFSAYRSGKAARLLPDLINTIDQYLSGTADFYNFGPYRTPLWKALAGEITFEDFWKPLTNSKVFDGTGFMDEVHMLGEVGFHDKRFEVLGVVPWQIWTQLLNQFDTQPQENELNPDLAVGDQLYGIGVLAIAAIQLALADTSGTDAHLKRQLCDLMPLFDSRWQRLDDLHPLPFDDTPSPYSIKGAVNKLVEQLRQASVEEDE